MNKVISQHEIVGGDLCEIHLSLCGLFTRLDINGMEVVSSPRMSCVVIFVVLCGFTISVLPTLVLHIRGRIPEWHTLLSFSLIYSISSNLMSFVDINVSSWISNLCMD